MLDFKLVIVIVGNIWRKPVPTHAIVVRGIAGVGEFGEFDLRLGSKKEPSSATRATTRALAKFHFQCQMLYCCRFKGRLMCIVPTKN